MIQKMLSPGISYLHADKVSRTLTPSLAQFRATLLQAERRGGYQAPSLPTPGIKSQGCWRPPVSRLKTETLIQGLQPWTWHWSHWVTLFNKEEAIKTPGSVSAQPESPPPLSVSSSVLGRKDLSEWRPQGKAFPVSSQMVTDETSPSYLHWPQNYQNLSCGLEMAQQFKSACFYFRNPSVVPNIDITRLPTTHNSSSGDLRPSPGLFETPTHMWHRYTETSTHTYK